MGPKRPVTDVLGDQIEKETIRGRNNIFVARFARLKKKTLVYCDTQRDWFSKYSYEIFRNIHLEHIQSDNDKMAIATSMAALYFPVHTEKNTTTSNLSFLSTFILKQTHMCVCLLLH